MMKQVVFGLHAVTALLENHPEKIQRLLLLKARDDKKIQSLQSLAQNQKIKIDFVTREELNQLAANANHQGAIAITIAQQKYEESDLVTILESHSKPLFLILDGVQDPHNLGACLRTADAAGVHAVIAPRDKAVGMTPTVAKVASGAAETVPFIQVTNLARTLKELQEKGVWIFGAAGDADKSIYETDFKGAVAIVLGAEGEGLRRLTREHCDFLVRIPMQGSVSSLNVSVAAGVVLFETVRQRT